MHQKRTLHSINQIFIIFQVSFKLNSVWTISTYDHKMRSKSYSLIFKIWQIKLKFIESKNFQQGQKYMICISLGKAKSQKKELKLSGLIALFVAFAFPFVAHFCWVRNKMIGYCFSEIVQWYIFFSLRGESRTMIYTWLKLLEILFYQK